MTPDVREPLEALARRLTHATAIAELIAKSNDDRIGTAVSGIAFMLDDLGDQLDEVLAPMRLAAGKPA